MKSTRLLIAAISMLLFAQNSMANDPQTLTLAPDFTLSDPTGKTVSLEDYKGKPLILHFWATWCPYCKKLQPGLDALGNKYAEQGLNVLAISFREDAGAKPGQVFADRGIEFTTLIDGDSVAEAYGVTGTPTTFFIDGNGVVKWKTKTSNPDDPKLEKAVLFLLKINSAAADRKTVQL